MPLYSNFSTKSYENPKFGMQVGVHQSFLKILVFELLMSATTFDRHFDVTAIFLKMTSFL